MTLVRSLAGLALALAFCCPALVAEEPAKGPEKVSYVRDVRPLFQRHCMGCHQPAKREGGYVMIDRDSMLKPGDSTLPGVVPGKVDESYLIEKITPKDGKAAMPQGKPPLAAEDIALITKWIAEGAIDDTPPSARPVVDAKHPPVYVATPVVTAVAFSPDGKLLAVAGYHEVLLHKADGSEIVARLVGLSERVQSLAFSPDGKSLAVAGGSPGRFGEVQIWDVESRKLKLSHMVTFDTLYGVSWSPDGKKVAFGCADNSLRAIEADTGKQVFFNGVHSDWVLDTAFSREGEYIVSVSRDMTIKLMKFATRRFIDNITSITPGALKGGLQAVDRRPFKEKKIVKTTSLEVGETGEKIYEELLIGGSDGVPRLYKMHRETKRVIGDDANKVREYEAMPGRLFDLKFSPDASRFVAGSSLDRKGEVRVYEVDSGKKLLTLEGQRGAVYSVAYSPDGKTIATAGFDGTVRLNDAETGKLVKEFIAVPLSKQQASK